MRRKEKQERKKGRERETYKFEEKNYQNEQTSTALQRLIFFIFLADHMFSCFVTPQMRHLSPQKKKKERKRRGEREREREIWWIEALKRGTIRPTDQVKCVEK